jgi:hypothetical protein
VTQGFYKISSYHIDDVFDILFPVSSGTAATMEPGKDQE